MSGYSLGGVGRYGTYITAAQMAYVMWKNKGGIPRNKAMNRSLALTLKSVTKSQQAAAMAEQGVSRSNTKYKPRRVRNWKSSFDKVNCTHGIVNDRDFAKVQANVAIAGHIEFDHRTRLTDMLGFSYFINPNPLIEGDATIGEQPGDIHWAVANSNYPYLFELVWYKSEMHIVNRQKVPCQIELYDYISIKDNADAAGGIIGSINYALENREGKINNINANRFALTSIDDVDFKIGQDKWTKRFWRCVKSKTVWLPPGHEHIHTVYRKVNYVFDYNEWHDRNEIIWKAGVTTQTLCRAIGSVGHWTGSGTASTIGPVDLDTVCRHSHYIRQVAKHADYFVAERGSAWPGTAEGPTNFNRMMEERPAEEQGGDDHDIPTPV